MGLEPLFLTCVVRVVEKDVYKHTRGRNALWKIGVCLCFGIGKPLSLSIASRLVKKESGSV